MKGKMKVAVMTAARTMEWVERDIPKTEKNELLIKLEYVGICGSDLHFFQDGRLGNWIPDGPLTLGHEPGGVVVEVGEDVEGFAIGDKVAIEPGVPCGLCEYCKGGRYNLCDHMSFMAIPNEREGVFSEYCAHPANMCYKLPEAMDTMEGALIEPLAVGFHAVQKSGAKVGQTAAVLGCGCIGLVTIMVLQACGITEIYVIDVIEKRLKKAEQLGVAKALRADKVDVVEIINSLPGGGVDLVFETAGNVVTTLQTAKMVKKGGSVTLVGMAPASEITYDIGTLMSKEAELHTVFRYRNLYPTAIAAVSQGKIPLKSIVSHVFDFKDVIEGVEFNVNNKQDVIKAVVKY
ncbi:MAG: alcohol dehydrogenase catalytic domain-containing protein [Eubacteriales bacterium]|nr:alcohol dehydrogenase catalytic domain-containing protein [Eubacteriales bacterium]